MTTKTDELKPCPFCGCANIHITPDEVGSGGQWVGPVHVVCGGDCVAGQSGDDRESAIAAWNRRAALQSQDAEEVMEMALCESRRLVLRIGQAYRFVPMGGCKTCEEMKAEHDQAYGIDHARRVEGDK